MATVGDMEGLKDGISAALVDTTRTAGQISSEDLPFLRSSNPSIVPLLDRENIRLLDLARRLTRIATLGTEVSVPQIEDTDSLEENWKGIVDVFDNLLEKADACLDEYTGAVRRLSPTQEEKMKKIATPLRKQRPDKAYRSQNIAKPQLLFDNVPTNDELTPFKPLLNTKPHAMLPLEESLVLVPSSDGSQQYKHPYESEMNNSRYPTMVHIRADPIPYTPYEGTAATMVDTYEGLLAMLEELKLAREIAVDLEHHDEHSYIGLVSLMQISTRDKDWIVDTLKPWRQKLQLLNEVFADPTILKVFHGAQMDMIWLQRDFGLYVVGLFDTFHASRALRYPRNGLAYLLKHFVGFDAAKEYQRADWRIRPLPEEMLQYARSDTHFLLYIYDNLRNELIERAHDVEEDRDLIEIVTSKSKGEALQQYERPLYDSEYGLGAMGWYSLLSRTPALFTREQFSVFRAVHQWRDTVARQEDESVHTVMPKQVLYNIARETPTDDASLFGCSHPISKIFKKKKKDLLKVIQKAKRLGANGPEMKDLMKTIQQLDVQRTQDSPANPKKGLSDSSPIRKIASSKRSDPPDPLARGESSLFWGSTIPEFHESRKLDVDFSNEDIQLALPLPQLTVKLFKDSQATNTIDLLKSQVKPIVRAEDDQGKDNTPEEETVFIVRQAGNSRKRKTSPADDGGEYSLTEKNGHVSESNDQDIEATGASLASHGSKLDRKPRWKKAKKEARRLENARQTEAIGGGCGPGDEEAFDYASAPTLLHAKRSGIESNEKQFANPYSKSVNAPKGLRKTRADVAGKSTTFKS